LAAARARSGGGTEQRGRLADLTKMSVVWQYRKMMFLAFGLLAAFALLAGQLVNLQVVRHEEFLGRAANNTVRTIARDPMRGQILDIRGNPLATSIPVKLICADPSLMISTNPALSRNGRAAVARALAPLLQTNEDYLLERLAPRLVAAGGKTNVSQYVALKHQASLETWERVRQTMAALSFGVDESKLAGKDQLFLRSLRAKAIFATDEQKRVYPSLTLAAHVIGYVSGEGEEQAGMNGIELEYNSKLSGIRGWRHTELDKRQRELLAYRDEDVEPRDGLNVVLTLDAGLQNIMESELAAGMGQLCPVSISSVMVRPRTGEILALANCPTFDPNRPGAFPRRRCAIA
jgi:cell division protein FtsI/penicillin-binding protein 2